MGDFNDLLHPSEKKGRVDHPNWLISGFRNAVFDSGLEDLPMVGHQFTWARSLGTSNAVEERLDRGMANMTWMDRFPGAFVRNSTAPISDHSPVVVLMNPNTQQPTARRFRFENSWCKEPALPNIVRDYWTNLQGLDILDKLTATSESLTNWARHLESNNKEEKSRLERQIQRILYRGEENQLGILMRAKHKLGKLLHKEEIYWKQRAKQHWLKDGDRNTKFFHAMASSRRKTNFITKLQREDGSWTTTTTSLHSVSRVV